MSRGLILIVDDQRELCELMREVLEGGGYQVLIGYDGAVGWKLASQELPDLVILDIEMPEMDGFQLFKQLRSDERTRTIPVIFVTKEADLDYKYRAFTAGADDYLTKPFQALELKLRVDARLRDPEHRPRPARRGFTLDPRERRCWVPGRSGAISLTEHETAILAYLLAHPYQPVSAKALMNNALDYPLDVRQSTSGVRNIMSRLREKIEPDPQHPRFLRTLPQAGYMLSPRGGDAPPEGGEPPAADELE